MVVSVAAAVVVELDGVDVLVVDDVEVVVELLAAVDDDVVVELEDADATSTEMGWSSDPCP